MVLQRAYLSGAASNNKDHDDPPSDEIRLDMVPDTVEEDEEVDLDDPNTNVGHKTGNSECSQSLS